MLRKSYLPAVLVSALLSLGIASSSAVASTATCPETMTFVVGGVGDTRSQRVPDGASGATTHITYPASLAPAGTTLGDASVRAGERALDRQARAFRGRCPESSVRVRGFSMGALIAGNVRDRWERDDRMRSGAAFTLIADPRTADGAMSRLPSFIPGFTHTGVRPASAIPTSSICRTASDVICSTGDVANDPFHTVNAAIGYLVGEHGYRDSEITDVPGHHEVPGTVWVQKPAEMTVAALVDVAASAASVVAPEVHGFVVENLVPPAEITLREYIPTSLKQYAPPILAPVVPAEIGEVVLPSVPEALADLRAVFE